MSIKVVGATVAIRPATKQLPQVLTLNAEWNSQNIKPKKYYN